MDSVYQKAHAALESFLGPGKNFRDGQYEAIKATLTNKRTLVVQRTGWGKSMVYFICTKILRDEQKGLTLIISPLLSLMKNQIEAAARAGLKCETLNSSKTIEEKTQILELMEKGEIDLVLTTPETLFTEKVQDALKKIKIGLFVVDEAHCISDWGHDFRLEYCRINKVISGMLKNIPVLATTATANDRVVEDLKQQLGGDVFVSRGPLMRKNLSIQVLNLRYKAMRYAWLIDNINKIPGSGIIYCLTQNDCEHLTEFLNENNINARAYHSGLDEVVNQETEQLFMKNEIKVIVATIKLGMGYDKPDISFVIHYQMPSNVVAYYQQIGRAGRNVDRAYTFLMYGAEDLDIQNYFIETAFPSKSEADSVYSLVAENEGIKLYDIMYHLNYSMGRVEKTLKFLENEEFVYKEKGKYYASAHNFVYNEAHYSDVKNVRYREQSQMLDFIKTNECYSKYIVNCLDDITTENCGICKNCIGHEEFSSVISKESLGRAVAFLEKILLPIEPRVQWAKTDLSSRTKIDMPNEVGVCLSIYGEQGYGVMVKNGKYETKKFSEELVEKSAKVLQNLVSENGISQLAYVPSLRSDVVKDFALRLASKLGISCIDVIQKNVAKMQKEMENSSFQCGNARKSFSLREGTSLSGSILLVDDVVDSKWTLTVCGYLLRTAGAEHVYPYALACSSKKRAD
ncbi:MAG: RecQ family ATP-dependent DNA helicase [Fibrobacter sp.]|nr:RecQ family ATP-dependent DNA helicase [Fibrobacter sp.]